MIIGHECAGIVSAVGKGVRDLKVGDRVALEPGIPCWTNAQSRHGRYNLDPNIQFFATPPVHGSLATFVDHPAEWCYKLPPHVSLDEGAMCEPLSVGVHACIRGGVCPGKKVAIMGAGPIGLVTLLAAKAFGADAVVITDLRQRNLDLARKLGADAVVAVSSEDSAEDTATKLKGFLNHDPLDAADSPSSSAIGFDVVIDCAGFEATVRTALSAAASGGRVVMVGLGQVSCNALSIHNTHVSMWCTLRMWFETKDPKMSDGTDSVSPE